MSNEERASEEQPAAAPGEAGGVLVRVAQFETDVRLTQHQRWLLRSMADFYTDDRVRQLLVPTAEARARFSLRVLDWLVTNYSKKHNVLCVTPEGELFNIHHGYKETLLVHKRRNFDPFRRRPSRVEVVTAAGERVPTTIGQMLFMRWAHEKGVLEYSVLHVEEIEADMNQTTRAARAQRKMQGPRPRKRTALSRAPGGLCTVYPSQQRVLV